jgi:phosphomethylpyrimidine synthase
MEKKMTLMQLAKNGKSNEVIKKVAKDENIDIKTLVKNIASGKVVIPVNKKNIKKRKIFGIGKGLKTKVNVNIGASPKLSGLALERKKLKLAIKHKADAIMDLSVGNKSKLVRDMVIKESTIPVGTVPIYQALDRVKGKGVENIRIDDFFEVVEEQLDQGVDFVTIHCGVTEQIVKKLIKKPRISGIVSRGGAIMAEWILKNKSENPFFVHYDRLLKLLKKYDACISLGDGLRPGCIADATDWSQIKELKILGDLTLKAWEQDVQVMIEGPGHIPINEIEKNMKLQKKYCHNAPFYVLGPLVTDVAPGYDHITAAIGGAFAGIHGANFLCFVTPAEHLHLPDENDLVEGLIASRIAAHSVDIAKNIKSAKNWAFDMSKARKKFDWDTQEKLSINPSEVKKRLLDKKVEKDGVCTMCGEFCSMKRMSDFF